MNRFEDLTDKQQQIIEAYVQAERELDREPTLEEVSDRAYETCKPAYVRETAVVNYPDVLARRRNTMKKAVTDGEGSYVFELAVSDTWRLIRLGPEGVSEKIYDQIREQQ